MDDEIYKRLAQAELDKLKEFATKDEKERLNYENFHPYHFDSCIYGQMTGHCDSIRSIELLNKCATPAIFEFSQEEFPITALLTSTFNERHNSGRRMWYSFLERYLLYCSTEEQKRILKELKGSNE